MRRTLIAAAMALVLFVGPAPAAVSMTGMFSPRAELLSDSDVSLSYASKVRLTPRTCGEFKIKFSVKDKSTRTTARLLNAKGEQLSLGYMFSSIEPRGTIYFKYCKTRWEDKQDNIWPGFKGGVVTVQLLTTVAGDPVKTTGTFLVTK